MIKIGLKYSWNGDANSSCTARVVITQAVVYALVTGGIFIYSFLKVWYAILLIIFYQDIIKELVVKNNSRVIFSHIRIFTYLTFDNADNCLFVDF